MKLLISLVLVTSALNADIENGKDVYAQNCANCHSISMTGGMGPDFNIVSYKRKREDIVKYTMSPSSNYKKFGYDANAMPKFPLLAEDIEDVSEYIDSLQPFKVWMKK